MLQIFVGVQYLKMLLRVLLLRPHLTLIFKFRSNFSIVEFLAHLIERNVSYRMHYNLLFF